MAEFAQRGLDRIPDEKLPPKLRARLAKLNQMMDGLGLLDEESQEIHVHGGNLRKLLREHLPPEVSDQYLDRLKGLPGGRFAIDAGEGAPEGKKMKPVAWEVVVSREIKGGPIPPGLSDSSTGDEIRRAVQKVAPNIPDEIFEPTALCRGLELSAGLTASSPAVHSGAVAPGVWECVVSNLGFWTAVLLVGVMIAASIALAAAIVVVGPVAAGVGAAGAVVITVGGTMGALFWAVFWGWFTSLIGFAVAGSVLTVIIACLLNPAFRR